MDDAPAARRWPTIEEVEAADITQLFRWNRFLPSPSDDERPAATRVFERLGEEKQRDPAAAVRASKAVGL